MVGNTSWDRPLGAGNLEAEFRWAMPLVPLTDTVLESWAEMLQVKLPWTPPGYWSITVTVSSTPGEGTGQGQAWPHILPEDIIFPYSPGRDLEAAQGAPRDPRRDSRGERSPWLPLETSAKTRGFHTQLDEGPETP